MSHAVKGLEARLGVRLLARNSRNVSLTEAGDRLVQTIAPQLEEIDAEMAALAELRDSPTGSIRITASDHAIRTVLAPRLKKFLPQYPGIKVELFADSGFVDLAAEQFDAGVRLGEAVAQDMIAVRIGLDLRFVVVATQRYFASRALPNRPEDLEQYNCVNLRLATYGGLWAWEFGRDGQPIHIRVDGQLIYNSIYDCLDAAMAGLGVAYVPEDIALPYIRTGHLVSVLEDWCPYWPGFHLYYPSRRQPSGAMTLLISALRLDSPSA
ncbi:HTH-type transcriptional regulator DmlR [compost metagenome]